MIKKFFLLMIITMPIIIIKGWSCFPSACNSPGKLETEPWTFNPGQDTNTETHKYKYGYKLKFKLSTAPCLTTK